MTDSRQPSAGHFVKDSRALIDGGTCGTSSSLLVRVRARDPHAWEHFVHLYTPLVYRWCRQSGLPASDAADVGQEVFCLVAQAIATFRHQRELGTFRGWLRMVTRNQVRHYIRQARRQPQGIGGSEATKALELAHRAPAGEGDVDPAWEDLALCRRAAETIRAEFAPQHWEAFWRVAVHGDRPADVAGDLGMSVSAVYVVRCRVVARLRAEFAGLIDFDGGDSGHPDEACDADT